MLKFTISGVFKSYCPTNNENYIHKAFTFSDLKYCWWTKIPSCLVLDKRVLHISKKYHKNKKIKIKTKYLYLSSITWHKGTFSLLKIVRDEKAYYIEEVYLIIKEQKKGLFFNFSGNKISFLQSKQTMIQTQKSNVLLSLKILIDLFMKVSQHIFVI